jgi:WD40 repeat protein
LSNPAISPDSKLIAFTVLKREAQANLRETSADPFRTRLVLFELQTGKIVHELDLGTEHAGLLAFSPDGKKLIAASNGEQLPARSTEAHLWDVATGKSVRMLSGHRGSIQSIAYNRDGTRLATASRDGTVLIWDTSK